MSVKLTMREAAALRDMAACGHLKRNRRGVWTHLRADDHSTKIVNRLEILGYCEFRNGWAYVSPAGRSALSQEGVKT